MKAMVVRELGGGFVPAEIDIADPIGQEVLVEVRASGLCHSDLSYSTTDFGFELPLVLGHEVAGVVSAMGPDSHEFTVGDHVVVCLQRYCGECRNCLRGRPYQCTDPGSVARKAGEAPRLTENGSPVTQNFGTGGFAQYSLVHERQLVRIPDELPFEQAALLGCGVVTGAGAVLNTADVQPGDSVVIIGAGGVGLNGITAAVLAQAATIVVVDVDDVKLERATRFGATHVVNSSTQDAVAAVREITGGGADSVFDYVGRGDVAAQGLAMTATGGGLYIVGVGQSDAASPTRTVREMVFGQTRVQGVMMGSTVPRRDIPRYAQLSLEGRFPLAELVSRRIALTDIDAGYEMLHESDVARVVITTF